MRIYFDACCLNRLTDDPSQRRIRDEARAIEVLIGFSTNATNVWVSSAVLEAEISRNPDPDRRQDAQALLTFVKQTVQLNAEVINRARELQRSGFSEFDSLHLASAESAKVQVFLTTDDRLVRRANRGVGKLALRVLNPIYFLGEVKNADARND